MGTTATAGPACPALDAVATALFVRLVGLAGACQRTFAVAIWPGAMLPSGLVKVLPGAGVDGLAPGVLETKEPSLGAVSTTLTPLAVVPPVFVMLTV